MVNGSPDRDWQVLAPKWADFSVQSLLDTAPDAVLVVNCAGTIILSSLQAEKMLGYIREQLIGKSAEELVPSRFRSQYRQYRESYFSASQAQPMGVGSELFVLRKDGTEVSVDITLSPITVGSETFVVAAIRDVNEKARVEELKKSEAVLRESEGRFRSSLDGVPALIWISGPDIDCTCFNKFWLDFTGRSKKTELGNEWAESVHPMDLQRCLITYVRGFDRREKFRMEYRLRRHDGEYRWISDTGVPRFNQDLTFAGYIGIGFDITELKQAETARRESEERFQLAMNNLSAGVCTLDLEGLVTYVNLGAERMFGWTSAELLGKKMHDMTHYKHRDGTPFPAGDCPVLQVVKKGIELHEQEDVFIRKDGSFFPVIFSASPAKANFQTVGIVVGFRDDTQRQKSEQALRESEERLRMVAQTGKMFAYEWDAITDRIVRSEGVTQILGENEGLYTTGQHVSTMVPSEDRERLIAAVARMNPEKPFLRIMYRMQRSDGAVIWVDRSSRAYFDANGRMTRIVGMIADITDRVRAEEALRQKEKELLEAQRLAAVGSWYWNVSNDMVTWSEEGYRITGCDPALPAPTFKEHRRLFTAESWERLQRAVEEALQHGTSYELDLQVIRPDGTTRWVRVHGEAVGDTTGRIVAIRGTTQDITERKLAEAALAGISRKLLEAQEQERTRIARELHDDISQQLALLSVEIQRVKELLPASAGELRRKIDALEKRSSEIATGVHFLSHELHSSRLEYLGLAVAMKGFCKEFGDKNAVEVAFASEDVPSTLPSEISLCLFRIMQEGLRNAAKHSGARFFEVKLQGSPMEIHLTVRDPGVGFEPELVADSPGLGLISMQERVRLVNGTISIISRPKSGTLIDVRVPLSTGMPQKIYGAKT